MQVVAISPQVPHTHLRPPTHTSLRALLHQPPPPPPPPKGLPRAVGPLHLPTLRRPGRDQPPHSPQPLCHRSCSRPSVRRINNMTGAVQRRSRVQ